ncbi:ArsR/SmtB family transcription factor [Hymenobacter monticola]|uniref:Metalloregulator ArsR/SmtB family transcription factor n=1 Tax=Hymenobacter monticola TaxID=1705399 RepID=A0ABY4B846_9BACT|nr:metalloregulator ArsR/SmtB family transcription factor [Hymenobacter monticola]UOE34166.1 metalloregulator ArsR/SmtB family transcription factor [Hymenobacter monticola]
MNTKNASVNTNSLVKLAKALSDPTRQRLLQEIAKGDIAVCADLFQYVPISQPSMSQHLKALSEAGLIESHKEGRNMCMSINAEKLKELEDFLQLLKPAAIKA